MAEPLKRTEHVSYGSTTEDSTTSPEWMRSTFQKYGGPTALLVRTWMQLIPILGPLAYIGAFNTRSCQFQLWCHIRYPDFDLGRVACDMTFPIVCVFPSHCQALAVWVATRTFIRSRLFYFFFQRKVIIQFTVSPESYEYQVFNAIPFLMIFELFLFCIHVWLMFLHGNDYATMERIWPPEVSFGQIWSNPEMLLEPQFKHMVRYTAVFVSEIFFPAVVAIWFTYDVLDVQGSLVPFGKVFDIDPKKVCKHLNGTIPVPEEVAREILIGNRDRIGPADVDKQTVEEACEAFRQEALSYAGVEVMGERDIEGYPTKTDSGQRSPRSTSVGLKEVSLPDPSLWEMVTKRWWQLEIILKDDFRKTWLRHNILLFLVILTICATRSYGVNTQVEEYQNGTHGFSTSVAYTIVMVPTMLAYFFALFIVSATIWEHS